MVWSRNSHFISQYCLFNFKIIVNIYIKNSGEISVNIKGAWSAKIKGFFSPASCFSMTSVMPLGSPQAGHMGKDLSCNFSVMGYKMCATSSEDYCASIIFFKTFLKKSTCLQSKWMQSFWMRLLIQEVWECSISQHCFTVSSEFVFYPAKLQNPSCVPVVILFLALSNVSDQVNSAKSCSNFQMGVGGGLRPPNTSHYFSVLTWKQLKYEDSVKEQIYSLHCSCKREDPNLMLWNDFFIFLVFFHHLLLTRDRWFRFTEDTKMKINLSFPFFL